MGVGADIYFAMDGVRDRKEAQAALALQNAGKKLTQAQQDAIKKWNDSNDRRKKFTTTISKPCAEVISNAQVACPVGSAHSGNNYYKFGFPDVLGMMLIGMGLYRMGFLTGASATNLWLDDRRRIPPQHPHQRL